MSDSRDNWLSLVLMRLSRSSRPGEGSAGRTLWRLIQCVQNLWEGLQNALAVRTLNWIVVPAALQQAKYSFRSSSGDDRIARRPAASRSHKLQVFVGRNVLKRSLSCDHLPEDDAEAVHIHFLVVRLPQGHFGSHVGYRASAASHHITVVDPMGQKRISSPHARRQTKVKQFQLLLSRESNIFRLQIYLKENFSVLMV